MRKRTERWLWVTVVVATVSGVARISAIAPSPTDAAIPIDTTAFRRGPTQDRRLGEEGRAVRTNNPFHLDRRPADVPYSPNWQPTAAPASEPLPTLELLGILGGPPWRAIIGGLPGTTSDVVAQAGQTIGDFTIRSVQRDSVVVQTPDTVWVLTLNRPGS